MKFTSNTTHGLNKQLYTTYYLYLHLIGIGPISVLCLAFTSKLVWNKIDFLSKHASDKHIVVKKKLFFFHEIKLFFVSQCFL